MQRSFASFWIKGWWVSLMVSGMMFWFSELPVLAGQSVTLSWNPSEEADVAGYKIYYGTSSSNYSEVVEVGRTNSATISGLVAGTTYYFAASTFAAGGAESELSNEASFAVPANLAATLAETSHAAGQFSFSVAGVTGRSYVVQASTNLTDWENLQTNTVPFVFVDEHAAEFAQRFYRTVELAD